MKKLAIALAAVCATGLVARAEIPANQLKWKKLHLTKDFLSEGATYGDINGDGKMDVISGNLWWEGPDFTKSHQYYEQKPFDPYGYSNNFFAFTHDFNKDGKLDILIIGFPGAETFWYENPGNQEGNWKRHLAAKFTDNESPTFGDFTGDGKPELLFHTAGQLGWAEPDWSAPEKEWTFTAVSGKAGWQRFTHGYGWGDVNGDGKNDILLGDAWWEQPKDFKPGDRFIRHPAKFAKAFGGEHKGYGGAQMYVYDVDGDGLNDVITSYEAHGYGLGWSKQVKSANGKITFEYQDIMGLPTAEQEQDKFKYPFGAVHAIDMIDVNGDGLKDLVSGRRFWAHAPDRKTGKGGDAGVNNPAVVYWFELKREGGTAKFIPHEIDDDSGVGTQVVAGDINGDKIPDVVIGNKKGTFVLLSQPVEAKQAAAK